MLGIHNVPIFDFSAPAGIDYFLSSGERIVYSYKCNGSKLFLGPAEQLYEVACYPKYYENLTFSAPQNQDAATILCKTSITWSDAIPTIFGITWAIPCNNIPECDNGSDEIGCEFPTWLIPSLLCGAGAVLFITLFAYLHKSIKRTWKKKMQFQFQNSHLSIETEKLYKTAILIESRNLDQIHKMYCQEVENNEGEGGALCHFKVMRHLIKSLLTEIRILESLYLAFMVDLFSFM